MDNEQNNSLSTQKNLPEKKVSFSENVQIMLVLAFDRVDAEISEGKVDTMQEAINEEFPDVEDKYIIQALKHGSRGLYGKTYKLSAQEVCIWIREYMKTNPEPPEDVWNRFEGKIRVAMEENYEYNRHQAKLHCLREKIIDDRIHSLDAKFYNP